MNIQSKCCQFVKDRDIGQYSPNNRCIFFKMGGTSRC